MKPLVRLERATEQARTGADWLPHLADLAALIEETEHRGSHGQRAAVLAAYACKALIAYGNVDTARELAESALRLRRVTRWTSFRLRYNRACAILHQGDIEGGRAELADVVKDCQDRFGPAHQLTNAIRAALYDFGGAPILEERFYRAVLAERLAAHGPEHADTFRARLGLAAAMNRLGHHGEAEAECRDILVGLQRIGEDAAATSRVKTTLGNVLHFAGRFAEAERELRDAIDTAGRWRLPYTLNALGCVLIDLRQPHLAEAALRGALVGSEHVYGPTADMSYVIRISLAWAVLEQDRAAEAVDVLRDVVPSMVARNPSDVLTLFARLSLARMREDLEEMRDVVRTYVEVLGKDDVATLDAQFKFGHALGHSEEAAAILAAVVEARTRILPPGHPDIDRARARLEHIRTP
ncbi:tetratricopeptide repeat protein [Streptosporangiaceae bacterium NEAU-GS5]|nr:tetratricopeptide repeat protein [Streptosporangiaceae bacterium NEAU-GS5]